MKLTRNIHSLSTFKRDTAGLVRQMKKTKTPVVLTVNGKAELVVQDAGSYQKLLEAKDRMEAIAGIKRGLESMKRGGGQTILGGSLPWTSTRRVGNPMPALSLRPVARPVCPLRLSVPDRETTH